MLKKIIREELIKVLKEEKSLHKPFNKDEAKNLSRFGFEHNTEEPWVMSKTIELGDPEDYDSEELHYIVEKFHDGFLCSESDPSDLKEKKVSSIEEVVQWYKSL